MEEAAMTVLDWLLDSDPAMRWQVMRDLTDAPSDEVEAERARVAPDERVAEAIAIVESKRDADGRWLLDHAHHDKLLVDLGEREREPSRWITLYVLRVLRWAGRES
jgi:hypothetical protein